jgi:hypothetical protein
MLYRHPARHGEAMLRMDGRDATRCNDSPHPHHDRSLKLAWVPACAGMTD